MSDTTTSPQVGDRVQVTITGRVFVRHDGTPHSSVQIELDPDTVVVGSFCGECNAPGLDCEDTSHAWREQVLTFAAPGSVVLIQRA